MAFETWNPPRAPQLGSSKTIEQRVNAATFGDGYEQAAADGLNSIREVWTFVWNGCPTAQADQIETFFRSKGLVTPFWYTPPGASAPLKFRFTSFRRTQATGVADTMEIGARQVFDVEY